MYAERLFTNKKVGTIFLVSLASVYALSVIACTIGFFTPYWLHGITRFSGIVYSNDFWYYQSNYKLTCQTAGLISGTCRFPYSSSLSLPSTFTGIRSATTDNLYRIARRMNITFYCVLGTMCVLYTNLAMTLIGFIFNLFDNRTFMAFVSIHYGVLYPLGALSVLTASIMLEVEFRSDVGYSCIFGTITGGLMLVFYFALRFYNDQYMRYRRKCLENDDMNFRDISSRSFGKKVIHNNNNNNSIKNNNSRIKVD